jgi:hypothetical protein
MESGRISAVARLRTSALLGFFSVVIVVVFGLAWRASLDLTITYTQSKQITWDEAAGLCIDHAGRLPSMLELLGLAHFKTDVAFVDRTDYWSADAIGGRAFGLNTRWGWLSFDIKEDTDHMLCVTSGR